MGPTSDLLNQKLWGPATCVLTSPQGDSDACSTLRDTALGVAWENKNKNPKFSQSI